MHRSALASLGFCGLVLCGFALTSSPALANKPKAHKPAVKFVHPCTKNPGVEQLRCGAASDGNEYAIEKCGAELFASSWKDGSSLERWPVAHSKAGGGDKYAFATTGFELTVKGKAGQLKIVKSRSMEKVACGAGKAGGAQTASTGGSAGSSSGGSTAQAPAIPAACGFCYGTALKTRPEWDSNLSAERRKILETAEGFLHQVSDCGGQKGEKAGADTLVDLYKTAFGSLDSATEKQVRKANNKSWRSGPWSWCGVFAAAVANKAGFSDVSWGIGKLKGRSLTTGHSGVQPGDIAVWAGNLNHHDIVEKIDGSTVYTLDGNQECSGIMRKKRNLKDIVAYYKIAND